MSYRIGLRFDDGGMHFIGCRAGETLADAAIRQGIRLPVDCREGACGTCRCQVESGQYDAGDCAEDALSPAEAAQGHALACQLRPRSDAVVQVPVAAALCQARPGEWTVQVRTIEPVGPRMLRFRVQADALSSLQFLPGQYAKVGVPGLGFARAYSFSSLVSPAGELDFLVRRVPGGRMSGWLADTAAPGATLTLQGPFGGFYLRPVRRPMLMLAGGTGIAPMLAMLEQLDRDGQRDQACQLMLGVNDDHDAAVAELLQPWQDRLPRLQVSVCVADPATQRPQRGYVTDHLDAGALYGGDVDIYVCGPPAMVTGVQARIDALGIRPASLHHERFNPSD